MHGNVKYAFVSFYKKSLNRGSYENTDNTRCIFLLLIEMDNSLASQLRSQLLMLFDTYMSQQVKPFLQLSMTGGIFIVFFELEFLRIYLYDESFSALSIAWRSA